MISVYKTIVNQFNSPSFFLETRNVNDGKMKTTTAPQSPPTYRMILPIVGMNMAKLMAMANTMQLRRNIFLYPTFSVFNTSIKNWLLKIYMIKGNTVIS